ncbi:MAG TPA: rhomboid family intramembrane serine protease [Nitrospirae bacterium]|nr:rhomboid family intramembrane serine protease [Nitrospirota bacterium]
MIPYKSDNPVSIFPFVTVGLIVVNVFVFILQMTAPIDPEEIVFAYGAIPHFLLTFNSVQPLHPSLTVFTSMFMHGSVLHLGGNMLYLWIFGNNIEDQLGHFRFLMFYLLCGLAAVYSHALSDPYSMVPMIGASGAVSGILGAYLLLFPRARIHTLVFLLFFVQVVRLPALFVIGFWILIQILNGMMSQGAAEHGGIAWFAHIGGFISGIVLIMLFFIIRRKNVFSGKFSLFKNRR